MSFGFSASDVVLLVQLAWTTVRNSRKACGEHAELTREITSLHVNLRRLEQEIAKPESPINRPSDNYRQDLVPIVDGCGKALEVLDEILEKYNALSDGERSKRKLWKEVRFGNGELANVKDLRSKLTYYTSNLSLFLHMVSMGSMGMVEKQMYDAGGDLKDIRRAVNDITAHVMSRTKKEGSVLTDYTNDDKAVWRAFRRGLVKEGFSSHVIWKNQDTIQAYVKELGSRGIPAHASRDERMGSFKNESGAARDSTGTTAHVHGLFGTGNGDLRENGTFPRQTPMASAPLTRKNISNNIPPTTQITAKINAIVTANDWKNRHRSSAPIPSVPICRYYYFHYDTEMFLSSANDKEFEFLLPSDPHRHRCETLEFQIEPKGFLKVAELRKQLRFRNSLSHQTTLLKVAPMFEQWRPSTTDRMSGVRINGLPKTIINDLKKWGLCWIDTRREKWRISKWP